MSSGIRLVVGLGNPGKEYERTRHNAGFWLVERLAAAHGVALRKDPKFQALVGRLAPSGAWLLLPQSFMNASGRPVQMLAGFFKIAPEEVLVVHDELDFEPGTARLKQGGGIAGHNGLRDISQRLGSHDYWRLRLGVGKPPAGEDGGDYVLRRPPQEEREAVDAAIGKSLELLPLMLSGDLQGAMQKLHTAAAPPKPNKEAPPEKPKAEPQVEKARTGKPKAEAKPKKPEPKQPEADKKPEGLGALLKNLLPGGSRRK